MINLKEIRFQLFFLYEHDTKSTNDKSDVEANASPRKPNVQPLLSMLMRS